MSAGQSPKSRWQTQTRTGKRPCPVASPTGSATSIDAPADQADAFAALLDALEIARTGVAAFFADAASALQFALRHPGQVNHMVVISRYGQPSNCQPVYHSIWATMKPQQTRFDYGK